MSNAKRRHKRRRRAIASANRWILSDDIWRTALTPFGSFYRMWDESISEFTERVKGALREKV